MVNSPFPLVISETNEARGKKALNLKVADEYIHADEKDVQIIQSPVGMPGRALRNRFIEHLEKAKMPISKCYNCLEKCNPARVPYCITKALIDAVKGDVDNGLVFCGANVGRIHEMTTVHALMQELLAGI